MEIFYLGTHEPAWLSRIEIPLFVSRRRLVRRVSLPHARCRWALDSGGFTELSTYGHWMVSAEQYAREATIWMDEIGGLDWAAPQDWMCEPFILRKTGKAIGEHQRRTIESLLELRALAPSVRWIPVLQGWLLKDYLEHVDMWGAFGVDLIGELLVGLGSVCRRQGMLQAGKIISVLAGLGISLHGFGIKTSGLKRLGHVLFSADSMAWSYHARRRPPLPGHVHKSCANCLEYALRWRERVIATSSQAQSYQGELPL